MGGEDWADWIDALKAADVLTENAVTVAYSYIGPELTYPIYYHGTIGTDKAAFAENNDGDQSGASGCTRSDFGK